MDSRLAELIDKARSVAVLTGAGISTESGIPDFRSPGGIWSQFRIIEYSEFMASEDARLEAWRRRFHMQEMFGVVKPNRGHLALAGLVESGKCPAIITQNIDGLHQEAGVPADKVVELHGTTRHANCTQCGLYHTIEQCRHILEMTGQAPVCVSCGGIVKSAVVMFGEAMPEKALRRAIGMALDCDLFIAIGTSLAVHPAASLPLYAARNGAELVIVNREPTDQDELATLVLNGEIGELLG